MTRKRLQDLVREEVQKASENETAPVKSAANSEEVKPSLPESEISEKSAKSPAKNTINSSSNQTELPDRVKELTASLETAEARSNQLQDRVTLLQLELQAKNDLIQKLETQLQQTNQLQEELATYQKSVNKLSIELEQAQAIEFEVAEQKKLIEKLYAELQKAQQQELEREKATQAQAIVPQKSPSYLMIPRPIGRSVGTVQSSSMLSNEEIGWFD